MLNKNIFVQLFLVSLALSSCGGGGGGSNSQTLPVNNNPPTSSIAASSATSSTPISQSSISSISDVSSLSQSLISTSSAINTSTSSKQSSSASSVFSASPIVTFIFPKEDSKVLSNTLTVRGLASDLNGIKQVRVNGVIASLTPSKQKPIAAQKSFIRSLKSLFAISESNSSFSANSLQTDVEWTATIDVPVGESTVNVDVEDIEGNTDQDSSATLNLRNVKLNPLIFLDKNKDQLVTLSDYASDAMTINLSDNKLTEITSFNKYTAPLGTEQLDTSTSSFLSSVIYYDNNPKGDLIFNSTDMITGKITKLKSFDFGLDATVWKFASVISGSYDQASGIYYFLVSYFPVKQITFEADENKSEIYSFNVKTFELKLIGSSDGVTPILHNTESIYYSNNTIFMMGEDQHNQRVLTLDPINGNLKTISNNLDASNGKIIADESGQNVFVVGLFNTDRVEVASGVSTNISPNAGQVWRNWQIGGLVLDESRHRLIIGDTSYYDILTIDTITGERSELVHTGVGDGRKLILPSNLVLTSDKQTAYIADRMSPEIIKVDLKNGNRTSILRFSYTYRNGIHAIALDESRQRLLVTFTGGIVQVNLNDSSYSQVYGDDVSSGQYPSTETFDTLLYDTAKDRLLAFSNFNANGIFAFDGPTFTKKKLFDIAGGDLGIDLKAVMDMVLMPNTNSLIVYDHAINSFVDIDLSTGERKLIVDKCLDNNSNNVLVDLGARFDFNENLGLIQASTFIGDRLEIDVNSKSCKVIPQQSFLGFAGIRYLDDQSLLYVEQQQLSLYDIPSNQRVVISR